MVRTLASQKRASEETFCILSFTFNDLSMCWQWINEYLIYYTETKLTIRRPQMLNVSVIRYRMFCSKVKNFSRVINTIQTTKNLPV